MKDNGIVTRLKDLESLNGQMVGGSKVVGSATSFMVVVFTRGQMDVATMANTLKIKSTGLVYINGQTAKSTRGIGKTANSTARVSLRTSRSNQGLVFGRMASV